MPGIGGGRRERWSSFQTLKSWFSEFPSVDFRNLGVLTPINPPSVVALTIIATDQAMEVDKAESIPSKTLAVVVSF